jgi:sugar lactone lactonase YvrE
VVFDRRARKSRRFADESTKHEPSVDFTINGVAYGNTTFTTPTDGIALPSDRKRVYYCALQGLTLYSVDAIALRDMSPSSSDAAVTATRRSHGRKPSPSDGIAFASDGRLFFGGLTTSTLYEYEFGDGGNLSDAKVLEVDALSLQWIDTFAFDDERRYSRDADLPINQG